MNTFHEIAFIVLLAALMLAVSGVAHASLIRDEEAQTVLVTREGFLGGGRGSGILLDRNHVLTCAHMLSGPTDELFVYTYPLGSVVKAKPEFVDMNVDLAVLTLAQPVVVTHTPIFEHHFMEGDPVTIIGNALGSMKWNVSSGIISSEESGFLLTDARINHGNSGGPWFDKYGSIIGLTDFMIAPKEGPGISGGISAATIEDFLERRESMVARLGKLLGV